MEMHAATEQAYKNGYEKGYEDGKKYAVEHKCSFGGITIKPDSVNILDPCIYEDIEMYANVTVVISRCKKCGHIEVSWIRQENTEEIEI